MSKTKKMAREEIVGLITARNTFLGHTGKDDPHRIKVLKEDKGGTADALKRALDEALIADFAADFNGKSLEDADAALVLYMHDALGLLPDEEEEDEEDIDLEDEEDEDEELEDEDEDSEDSEDEELEDEDEDEDAEDADDEDAEVEDAEAEDTDDGGGPEEEVKKPRKASSPVLNTPGGIEAALLAILQALNNGCNVSITFIPKTSTMTPAAVTKHVAEMQAKADAEVAKPKKASKPEKAAEVAKPKKAVEEAKPKKARKTKGVSGAVSRKHVDSLSDEERFIRDRINEFRKKVLKRLDSEGKKRSYIKKHDIDYPGKDKGKALSQLTDRSLSLAIMANVRTLAAKAYAEKAVKSAGKKK